MQVISALYDNGQFLLMEQPLIKKAKVLITFTDEVESQISEEIPVFRLGEIFECSREEIYDEYLSSRY